MKKFFFSILAGGALLCALNCNRESVHVEKGGEGPSPAPTHSPGKPAKPTYVYGNYFQTQDSSAYKTLLSACRRCGEKRLIINPYGGGASYQRFWTLEGSPIRCDSWNSEGYIQIAFAEKRLPTTATVSIQPKFTGTHGTVNPWGSPFEITAQAKAINKNKGFQILIQPKNFGGISRLDIHSSYSNHVKQPEGLDVTVEYGEQNRSTIISERLKKQTGKPVRKSHYNCDVYPN